MTRPSLLRREERRTGVQRGGAVRGLEHERGLGVAGHDVHGRGRCGDELLRVYQENVRVVYGFFTYSVSQDTAEDLTATTFEHVVRAWSRFDPECSQPRTWIMA